jgi:hypothetical protein
MGYFMVTVHRAYGFRFVMFTNDHDPPHVHVFGQGGEAKLVLERSSGVRIEWAAGISRTDLQKIKLEAERQQALLIQTWAKIHG